MTPRRIRPGDQTLWESLRLHLIGEQRTLTRYATAHDALRVIGHVLTLMQQLEQQQARAQAMKERLPRKTKKALRKASSQRLHRRELARADRACLRTDYQTFPADVAFRTRSRR